MIARPMKQIVVRFIVMIVLAAFVQACASASRNPNNGPDSEQGEEFEKMDQMLNPVPNGEPLDNSDDEAPPS